MKKIINNLILRFLLKKYKVIEKQMPPEAARTGLIEFANNENLQKYINIMVGNLIRRHLYVNNMDEKNNLSGQVMALRKLQELGKMSKDRIEKENVDNKI